ncbi:IclR family transcriptional regulator [Domibacillus epiphyticus]|uniref:IclR family transcriptional regulator n=1 Tax=Domibacillus epiphyticus TaxID=1714355 RepID=A0A1V2A4S2_9BACI|nr:IclR family transcriptional regulator [Domibacillus epiphyticus]OMP66003.1 IclR family transcriptional regulator [Domibacillus epiphyticus]
MDTNKPMPVIGSLQTGIQIIDTLIEQDRPLKFTEIQELTGITKSNLYKYLNTLTMLGLLYRDKKKGTFSLGSKLIEYGNAAIGSENVISRVTPYLKDISRHTQLTALLSVWTHDGPVIANIWSASYGLNIGAQIGTKLPLLSSAGKMMAAFQQSPDVNEWKISELKNLTDDKKERFERELDTIRNTYFSYAGEPLVDHVSSFSVPILNYKKELVGAITVVGFNQLIPEHPETDISQFVLKNAFELSESFGWH